MKTLSLGVSLAFVGLLLIGCSGNDPKVASTPEPSAAERSGSHPQATMAANASSTVAPPTRTALATVPPPAPSPAPQWGTPIVGDVNLTGQVANDIPGTLIAVGYTVTSVVDKNTKPRDVYAMSLTAGDTYQIELDAPYRYSLDIANPGSRSFDYSRYTGKTLCWFSAGLCSPKFAPAVSGVYYLSVTTDLEAIQYTLHIVKL